MSHCSLLELVLKQRAWVSLALMRGGALALSGLLDLTLGLGCGLISLLLLNFLKDTPGPLRQVKWPQDHKEGALIQRGSLLCGSGHDEGIGFIEVTPTDCWGLPDLSKWQKKLFIVLQLYPFHILFSHSHSTFIMLELLASKPVMIVTVFDSHKIKILLFLISPPTL